MNSDVSHIHLYDLVDMGPVFIGLTICDRHNEDHCWALLAKRLANETTEQELQELDELLKKYSGAGRRVKVIADWWHGYILEEIVRRGEPIFEKAKEQIKSKR